MYLHSYLLRLALLAAVGTFHAPALAQSATPLSLAAAITRALDGNRGLASAHKEIDAADAALIQAGARPNPAFSLLMEDTRQASRTTTYQLSQSLELGGKRQARLDAAGHARELAALDFQARRIQVQAGVTAAYFQWLVALQRQRLAHDSLPLARTAADMAARRVAAGKVSPVEHTRALVAQAQAQLEQQQADSDALLARAALAAWWSGTEDDVGTATEEAANLPRLPELAQLAEGLARAPAIRQAETELARRRALVRVEDSRAVPDLSLVLGSKRDAEAGRSMWVVGVSVPIPLFDRNTGNRCEAISRSDQARDALAEAQVQVSLQVRQAHERLRLAREEAQILAEQVVPAARQAYQAARVGFGAGKFAFLDVLDAQRTYFQAELRYWNVVSSAHQAAAELARLVAEPTSSY